MDDTAPLLRFYRFHDAARPPERADRSAGGTLPTRAFRYCEAVAAATGLGWYVFAPIDFALRWDGDDIWWHCRDLDGWALLDSAQLPGLSARFDAAATDDLQGFAPPFLTTLGEPGLVQVWTGIVARTRPGWSLHVRAPANFPQPGGFVAYEGIVETDHWFGPLFTNIRLTRTHTPVVFHADQPLLQVQPLPRSALAAIVASKPDLASLDTMANTDWQDWTTTIATPARCARPPGAYAAAARQRARGVVG